MLWFFDRKDEYLQIETRYDQAASEYVVTVQRPDRSTTTERFADPEMFQAWLDGLEADLLAQRWVSRGEPVVVPDDWRSKAKMP
jgi:hypothetical protein